MQEMDTAAPYVGLFKDSGGDPPTMKDIVAAKKRLKAYHWTTQERKGLIVLVHGFGEHLGRYFHVANFFVKQGQGRMLKKTATGWLVDAGLLISDDCRDILHFETLKNIEINNVKNTLRCVHLIGESWRGFEVCGIDHLAHGLSEGFKKAYGRLELEGLLECWTQYILEEVMSLPGVGTYNLEVQT